MQIRRVVAATAAVTIAATSLVACSSDSDDSKTIKVGTTDDAKKAWVAFEQEAKNAGYDIDIQPFADYNTPNQALNQGELDTNNFQHLKFLAEYNHGNGTNLVPSSPPKSCRWRCSGRTTTPSTASRAKRSPSRMTPPTRPAPLTC